MGYRHQVISDTMVPDIKNLPKWFLEKYEGIIDFNRDYWASYSEHKRYGVLSALDTDVQKVIQELDCRSIRLVYFADESGENFPDIIHTAISATEIIEKNWGE
ncbi:hypothetical protein [Shewanella sp. T24-MNA-CIBAN-0130]|uniref:hypothetical protein n=1 Tax=Shewanella sp. T24-MNA-CIBAN-0130 TaxID=3140470 RepID=UPI00331A8F52